MTTPRRHPLRAARCQTCRSALITPREKGTRVCDACQAVTVGAARRDLARALTTITRALTPAEARHASRGFTHRADTD